MFVPVTTKPFLNSVNFSVPQRVSLHFFLLIKEKTNQHFTSSKRGIHGCHILRFAGLFNLPIPTCNLQVIRFAFGIGVSRIKEEFYNGKSSGI